MNIGNYIYNFFRWIFIPPRILQVMNHKISVRRQNLIQKFKKNIPSSFDYFDFSDISLFFSKIVPHLSQIFVFSFSIFLEIFRQTKNFMKERSSSENWKKKRRRKLKEKKKKKLYQSVYWCHSMQWIQFLETHLCINNRKKHFFFVALDSAIKDVQCVYFFRKKTREKNWKKKKKQKISSTIVKIKTKLSVVNCLSFGHICVHIFYLLQIEKK